MASDIVNRDGGITGNQNLGDVTVNLQGKGGSEGQSHDFMTARRFQVALADIHDKYDTRFDNPRYYTGDAAT